MKQSELLALGQIAIAKGLFDIRLRAAWLKMKAMANSKDAGWRQRTEDGFCARTKHLILTGAIEVARPKQAKRRAA